LGGVEDTEVLIASFEHKSSQGKGWIFDLGSTVHVYFQKELFNYLVAKEEGTIKMVDGLTFKVIGTETVKVTKRDGMVRALEAVSISRRHATI